MRLIVNAILNRKRATRQELARATELSESSVVKYATTLLDMGLVIETTRESTASSRGGLYLELNPEAGFNVVVVMKFASIEGMLVDAVGTIRHSVQSPVPKSVKKDDLLNRLFSLIETLSGQAESLGRSVTAIGIGLGGYINPDTGVSHQYLYSTDWIDVPLRQIVEERFGLRCFLINDVNAVALGEKYYGRGIGVDNFLCVWLGEGIGMGIVLNGQLYAGETNYAGELGHTHTEGGNTLCYCGHTGCLETVVSEEFLLRKCEEGLNKGVVSEINQLCEGDLTRLRTEYMIRASNNGDRFARNLFSEVAEHVGNKLVDVANLLNPALIILRGSYVDNNDFLVENIERIVKNNCLQPISGAIRFAHCRENDNTQAKGISSHILLGLFG